MESYTNRYINNKYTKRQLLEISDNMGINVTQRGGHKKTLVKKISKEFLKYIGGQPDNINEQLTANAAWAVAPGKTLVSMVRRKDGGYYGYINFIPNDLSDEDISKIKAFLNGNSPKGDAYITPNSKSRLELVKSYLNNQGTTTFYRIFNDLKINQTVCPNSNMPVIIMSFQHGMGFISSTSSGISTAFNECLLVQRDTPKTIFIFIEVNIDPLTKDMPLVNKLSLAKVGHRNSLIVDIPKKQVFHFEPKGIRWTGQINPEDIKEILNTWYTDFIKKNGPINGISNFNDFNVYSSAGLGCPLLGSSSSIQPSMPDNQLCQAYSFYAFILVVLNPKVPIEKIWDMWSTLITEKTIWGFVYLLYQYIPQYIKI